MSRGGRLLLSLGLLMLAGCSTDNQQARQDRPRNDNDPVASQPAAAAVYPFVYAIEGEGKNVKVEYFDPSEGMIEATVTAPWTSPEMEAIPADDLVLRAEGPDGSFLECVMKWREEGAAYGKDGSGESSMFDEGTTCVLENIQVG